MLTMKREQEQEDLMSEDNSNSADGDHEDRICRDFLRNVCRRGRRCKYLHPERVEYEAPPQLTFCHDFQNKQCSRPSCRFLHCSRDEEELYKVTGELPPAALEAALRQGLLPPGLPPGEPPVCKDYLKGDCRRGNQCKFKHMAPAELQMAAEPLAKRRRMEVAAEQLAAQAEEMRLLEEDNVSLRRRLDELRRQLHALAAANELLLEQNARLRLSKGPVVSLPAVTITNSQAGPPVTIATAVAPGSVAQVSLATAGISIAPPIVTVAQTLPPPPQNQPPPPPATQPQPLPMSISGATAPLVSFPLVTQSLRPQLPSGLAH